MMLLDAFTEVPRTRLRQEGVKYRSFWQTLGLVLREEGFRALYRGLCTQLVRQIPNTAVMMSSYEATVYLLTRYLRPKDSNFYESEEPEQWEWQGNPPEESPLPTESGSKPGYG